MGLQQQFDYVVANPMWNQDNYDESFYENDRYGRFALGIPPRSSADWGWAQHILASLNDHGRAAMCVGGGLAACVRCDRTDPILVSAEPAVRCGRSGSGYVHAVH